MSAKYFELGIYALDQGAGLVTIHTAPSYFAAEAAEDLAEREPYAQPFEERTTVGLQLKLEDGRLYYEDFEADSFETKWVELPLISPP